jgi:Reverse transcriptase (RNA-dependent DNA polymerase)
MQPPSQQLNPPLAGTAASATHRALVLLTLTDPDVGDVEIEGESPSSLEFAATGTGTPGTDTESVKKARKLDNWPAWDASIRQELDQHEKMGTWTLVEPPSDANIVWSHLILRYKRDTTGAIASRKSQFIMQGFSQAEGIDYNETFAPTMKLTAIRIIAALSVRNDWELEQTDVDGAYLNVPLKDVKIERVYSSSGVWKGVPCSATKNCKSNRGRRNVQTVMNLWS